MLTFSSLLVLLSTTNLAQAQSDPVVTASSTYDSRYLPTNIFDGSCETSWNSGGYPVAWIQAEFDEPREISGVIAHTTQVPLVAYTVHEISVDGQLVHTWAQVTETKTNIEALFDVPVIGRTVRVTTVQSPSWVGWREINFYFADGTSYPGIAECLGFVLDDADDDGVLDASDNCPDTPNPGQDDRDFDGVGDVCDICPFDPGDDSDGDGSCDSSDPCPYDPDDDADADTVCGDVDMCPDTLDIYTVDQDGCDMVQTLAAVCPCDARNHGAYVSCVGSALSAAVAEGRIGQRDRGAYQSAAARSDCGK